MNKLIWLVGAWLVVAFALPVCAQDERTPEPPPSAPEAPAEPAQPTEEAQEPQPSSDRVIEELEQLRRRKAAEPIEPTPSTPPRRRKGKAAEGAAASTSGTSPAARRGDGAKYREGEPILGRRGRMVRATDGPTPWMLTFNADSAGLDDPPLYLMPSQELEEMEAVIETEGEGAEFLVTGEVFIYRGQAYLLPRIARLAADRGNLTQ